MKISTINFQASLDTKKNGSKILEIVEQLSSSDLVVFPEASLQGYAPFPEKDFIEYYLDSALNLQKENDFTTKLKLLAKKNNQVVVLGIIERDDSIEVGRLYDSALFIFPDGSHATYRKTHLATNEPIFLFAGDSLPVFSTPFGKIGTLICYDQCFCDAGKTLAVRGAEILIIISAWSYSNSNQSKKEKDNDHSKIVFDLYNQVRAVENQCVVVVSNQVGVSSDNSLDFLGSSKIILPSGKIIGQLDDRPGILTHDLDLNQELLNERALNTSALNILKNRRPELYD